MRRQKRVEDARERACEPRIHVGSAANNAWLAGSNLVNPAMTIRGCQCDRKLLESSRGGKLPRSNSSRSRRSRSLRSRRSLCSLWRSLGSLCSLRLGNRAGQTAGACRRFLCRRRRTSPS